MENVKRELSRVDRAHQEFQLSERTLLNISGHVPDVCAGGEGGEGGDGEGCGGIGSCGGEGGWGSGEGGGGFGDGGGGSGGGDGGWGGGGGAPGGVPSHSFCASAAAAATPAAAFVTATVARSPSIAHTRTAILAVVSELLRPMAV